MTDTAANARARNFTHALGDMPVYRTSRNATWARLGLVLQVVGGVLTLLALALSQTTSNPLEQATAIALGPAGLALVGLGGPVFLRYSFGQFLRFWLLRLSDEVQNATDAGTRA